MVTKMNNVEEYRQVAERKLPAAAAKGNRSQRVQNTYRPYPYLLLLVQSRLGSIILSTLSVFAGLALWQVLTASHVKFVLDFSNIPTVMHVLKAFLASLSSKAYWKDILWSMIRISVAFTIGTIVGIAVGVSVGYSTILRAIISPYLEILRPIPAIAWVPMAILMWPSTEESIIFITFLGAVFPIALNTWDGVRRVPYELIKAARSLGAKKTSVLFNVVIPYAIPNITVGMALGMGGAWFALLAGEMISGRFGIGYFTWESYELIQYGNIIVGMVTIGILSAVSTKLIYVMKQIVVPWAE